MTIIFTMHTWSAMVNKWLIGGLHFLIFIHQSNINSAIITM